MSQVTRVQEPLFESQTQSTFDKCLMTCVGGRCAKKTAALDFDDCNGHIDRARSRYHYHGLPHCLLRKLGSAVPRNSSWWTFRNTSSWLCLQVCQKKWRIKGTARLILRKSQHTFELKSYVVPVQHDVSRYEFVFKSVTLKRGTFVYSPVCTCR